MGKTIGVVLNLKDKMSMPLKDIAAKLGTTEKELKKANIAVKKFQSQVGTGIKKAALITAAGAAAIGAGIATIGMAWIKLASDAEETNNKISVVFGKSSQAMQNWAKSSIQKMGLAGQSALDSAALFGDMARGMGINEKKAAGMAMSLTQLSADLASFKNIRQDVATTALNGIFSGETESLKQLGIVMTQANLQEYARTKGIKKKIDKMKEAEKVQLRYNYVLEKTKLAQGDFERTGGGTANQLRMFEELKKQIGSNIGKIFLPEFTKQLKQVNTLLIGNMPKIQAVTTQAFNAIGNTIKFVTNNLNLIIPIAGAVLTSILAFKTIQGVIAVIETWKAACLLAAAAQKVWNMAMLANPIGMWIKIVAIAAPIIIGFGIALYNNYKPFRDLVDGIVKKTIDLWNWLKKITGFGNKTISINTNINKNEAPDKKVPGHALGTSYFAGGKTNINEGGRSEKVVLPSGSQIIPHNETKKANKNSSININITVQGNMIGNDEFLNHMGAMLTNKVKTALANI